MKSTTSLLVGFSVVAILTIAAAAQTPSNNGVQRPSPDIPGVIKGGAVPQIAVRGLRSADDPLWLPDIGLVFSESAANRVVRLGPDDQVVTFVGDLHGPLGMTFSRGKLISLQTQDGFRGPRVIWPAGEETIDDEGRVYALTEAGIEVVSSTGQHLGAIHVWCITRRCQNLTFGGPDKRTLYVAGGGTLLRIPMLARGFAGRVK